MFTGQRVVVTGIGILAANGNDKKTFWDSLLAGRSGVGPVTLFDCAAFPCRIAGEVKNFRVEDYLPAIGKAARRMSRASQLAIAATCQALADAQLDAATLQRHAPVVMVCGTSTAAMDIRARKPLPWSAVAGVPHGLGSAVAYSLGLQARLLTVSNGCASGLDALAVAVEEVRQGRAELAIALAADSAMEPYTFECFVRSKRLSLRNDDPEHADRPFDRSRDGGVIGEGSGVVIVENRAHAAARGVPLYGEILGYGTNTDPIGEEEGSGQADSMRAALQSACLRPEALGAICAHAPGDPHMDAIEVEAIKRVLGARAYGLPVFSIKGATANPMGSGGMQQLITACLAFRSGQLPATTNLTDPDPRCDLDHVAGAARRVDLANMLVNTHGFGRGNSSLVIASCGAARAPVAPQMVRFSPP